MIEADKRSERQKTLSVEIERGPWLDGLVYGAELGRENNDLPSAL